jgi:hypothetical protein
VRIIEDANYPSSPPPPNANPDGKKPRLIIVAVRKSGRVRMHKARENANGTFSIGKTWMLDELSAVESFTGSKSSTFEEEQRKQWAGGTGFIVTLLKPYYWQANTPKEKDFFIASLVKIFVKYTGGKTPQLIGFDPRQADQLSGMSSSQSRPPPSNAEPRAAPLPPSQAPPPSAGAPYGRSQSRERRRAPSREPGLRKEPSREAMQKSPGRPPPGSMPPIAGQTSRPQTRSRRDESPGGNLESNNLAPQSSQTNLRRVAGQTQNEDPFTRGDDIQVPPRSRGGINGAPGSDRRFRDGSATPNSQRTMTPEAGFPTGQEAMSDAPPVPAPLALPPERRRPPMLATNNASRGMASNENLVSPLSPALRRDEVRPPTRSSDRPPTRSDQRPTTQGSERSIPPPNDYASSEPRPDVLPDANENKLGTATSREVPNDISESPVDKPQVDPIETSESVPTPAPLTSPDVVSPTSVSSENQDEERPGLGPMIKKKSKGDLANKLFKAANAASAFKPRVGGAAERLRAMAAAAKEQQGPDGITGVVPAPSLLRAMSNDSAKVAPLEPKKSQELTSPIKEVIPEVKVTVAPPERPKSVASEESTKSIAPPEKAQPREARRPKPTSEITKKHLQSLGVDPSILDGRGTEFATILDDFGWIDDGVHSKSIEQMREDIDRELNKAQAGSWLNRLEEEDDRVEAIKKGLDSCMAECEELDGLLTLYGVELGVCPTKAYVGITG